MPGMPPAPGRVVIAGDWHGEPDWARHVIKAAGSALATEPIRIILHAGDFGIWPGDHFYLSAVQEALRAEHMLLFFVDGNHEDHDRLAALLERHEGEHGTASPIPILPPGRQGARIFWLPRGYRWEWHDRTWLAMGGGVSIDAHGLVPRAQPDGEIAYVPNRTEGLDWWPGEEITAAQVMSAMSAGPADVMLSHDCPAQVRHSFFDRPSWWAWEDVQATEAHQERLQLIVSATRVKHIIHGHLHRAYSRECDFGYGPVQVTGLDCDGSDDNFAILDVRTMEWT